MDLVKQHPGQDLADARAGLEPMIGLHVIDLGGAGQVQLQPADLLVERVDHRQVHCGALVHA
jgi:hypothetical protein